MHDDHAESERTTQFMDNAIDGALRVCLVNGWTEKATVADVERLARLAFVDGMRAAILTLGRGLNLLVGDGEIQLPAKIAEELETVLASPGIELLWQQWRTEHLTGGEATE